MKSPAVIYALRIQKETNGSATQEHQNDNEHQSQPTQKALRIHSNNLKGNPFLMLMLIILFLVTTGIIILYA